MNGYNAQKENKQGMMVQYRPQTQIKEVYNEEAQYRTVSQANQSNFNRQNQMAPNAPATETCNKVHPNITPHSYVQEQQKKEQNKSESDGETNALQSTTGRKTGLNENIIK